MSGFEGPVGIFDSGVGGLTVLNALLSRQPDLPYIYVADQAHVPYGERSLDEVARFARSISRFLAAQSSSAVIMACNISSATALGDVRDEFPHMPVFGVVEAGARGAYDAARSLGDCPSIGVLATTGTVHSGAYPEAIRSLLPDAVVEQVACPDLVPIIENGEEETPRALARCMEYLEPLADAECSVLILGCTHYPLALSTLRVAAMRLYETPPVFVDPAQVLALEVLDRLASAAEPPSEEAAIERGQPRVLTSGPTGAMRRQIRRISSGLVPYIGSVVWTPEGTLEEVIPAQRGDQDRRNVRSANSGLQRSLRGQPEVPNPRDT